MHEPADAVNRKSSPPYASATAIQNFFTQILTIKDPRKIDAD